MAKLGEITISRNEYSVVCTLYNMSIKQNDKEDIYLDDIGIKGSISITNNYNKEK